jgi:putative ABC transport system ATP-binding protein
MSDVILRARKLSKTLLTSSGPLEILNGVDVAVATNEAVAIVGASGSGKSTLLGLLAGLDLPSSGSVELSGKELTVLDEDERARLRARQVGFVFQAFHLIDDLTAEENVALPLELFGHDTPMTTARDWLGRLGLSDRRQHFPRQLSGGEQQRVALCRAFASQPKLLFADEPTANLDRETASGVICSLFELCENFGTAMLLVTHDSALAERCDRMLQLDRGRLL